MDAIAHLNCMCTTLVVQVTGHILCFVYATELYHYGEKLPILFYESIYVVDSDQLFITEHCLAKMFAHPLTFKFKCSDTFDL